MECELKLSPLSSNLFTPAGPSRSGAWPSNKQYNPSATCTDARRPPRSARREA